MLYFGDVMPYSHPIKIHLHIPKRRDKQRRHVIFGNECSNFFKLIK